MKKTAIFLTALLSAILLPGCSTLSQPEHAIRTRPASSDADIWHAKAAANFYPLVESLSQSLNHGGILNRLKQPIASSSFVAVDQYKLMQKPDALGYLGFNVEEAMISALTQQGVEFTEYRMRGAIQLDGKGSYILDKSPQHARAKVNARYLLTGVVVPIEGGANITAKVIDFSDGQIISSATAYFPYTSQFKRKLVMIDGMLYRDEGY